MFKTFSYKNIAILPIKSFISYPSVELFRFYIDSFSLTTTSKKVAAFKQLAFLATLKALEHYISATSFLQHLIPYYAKLLEPLQGCKTVLLA